MLFFEKKNQETNNTQVIEQVILENYNQYYRLAYSYVHNEADALDIVQNGAYHALKSSHTLQKPEYAKTWVYRIMLNECFRFHKQSKFISYEAVQDAHGIETAYQEDSYVDVDLQRAVEALPPEDKAVVILKYFEDKKISEIAKIMGENTNTIKSRLYRSIKKLRNALSDGADERMQQLYPRA